MSLDVTLTKEMPCCVFDYNITHNLVDMAEAAGIYKHLWRPEEIGIFNADQLIQPLKEGLAKLQSDPTYYKKYEPDNGWGSYDGLVCFVERYLAACIANPDAKITVSR
jgi:hypothetical protein